MHVLLYNEIRADEIPELKKITRFLENDDFQSADVKKFNNKLYCARLNRTDRLLFTLHKSANQTYALIIEHIKNHAYNKSRFLKHGAKINEDLIPTCDPKTISNDELETLPHLAQNSSYFHLLQKPITFDQSQQHIYNLTTPILVIGTAGSGKTLILLEKMKHFEGNVLYITQSSYLARHSQSLYYSNHYSCKNQTTAFLSFQDLLDSIAVQPNKAVTYKDFKNWFVKHINTTPIKDIHALFEEFRGVITGSSTQSAYLSRQEYLSLGVKESIFMDTQRNAAYDLFEQYLDYLKNNNKYDPNLVSHDYLDQVKKHYDYVVVDEVQDFSVIQLHLIMSTLTHSEHFLLCGDANQIVYPNFFSWSKIKSLFLTRSSHAHDAAAVTQILNTNYRNSIEIIDLANRLLRIKNWRFGSIDKNSHHEIKNTGLESGNIVFLANEHDTLADINAKTSTSKKFAIIVLHDEMKPVAAKYFHTPLIFSVQECKGLEYENIILFNMVSSASQSFKDISQGVTTEIIDNPIRYARNKDKTDKSLEKYKFFINALFVAITRAQSNLYWIEEEAQHPLLSLLQHQHSQQTTIEIDHHTSSQEEWQQEASKLEQQGKSTQAQHIRESILQQQTLPWQVIAGGAIDRLFDAALNQGDKKAKLALFEYALVYEDHHARNSLIDINFAPALQPENGMQQLLSKYFMMYQLEQLGTIKRQMAKYGVDFRNPFNQTPLMIAAWLGNDNIIQLANSLNADPLLANNQGLNAFQIALEQACLHNYYATDKLQTAYPLLSPDTLNIRIRSQLITLDNHQTEFFLINLMIALFYRILPENMIFTSGAYTANNLVAAIEHWPDGILPEKFRNLDHIHRVLEKHQLSLSNNNPPFFIKVSDDNYLLNPEMILNVEGEWLPVYQVLLFDELSIGYQSPSENFDTNNLYKKMLHKKIAQFQQLLNI